MDDNGDGHFEVPGSVVSLRALEEAPHSLCGMDNFVQAERREILMDPGIRPINSLRHIDATIIPGVRGRSREHS